MACIGSLASTTARVRGELGAGTLSRALVGLQGELMTVEVSTYSDGEFLAAIFHLPDGRVLVTNNAMPDMAELYRSKVAWETEPERPLEEYASVAEAFAALE